MTVVRPGALESKCANLLPLPDTSHHQARVAGIDPLEVARPLNVPNVLETARAKHSVACGDTTQEILAKS
jgi:hypothetical protein